MGKPITKAPAYQTAAEIPLPAFFLTDSGKIRAGIRHWIRTDLGLEDHECYQFDSYAEVIGTFQQFQQIKGMERVELVTCKLGYKNMRLLCLWNHQPTHP